MFGHNQGLVNLHSNTKLPVCPLRPQYTSFKFVIQVFSTHSQTTMSSLLPSFTGYLMTKQCLMIFKYTV